MHHHALFLALSVAFVPIAGALWRLGGGAFTSLSGDDPGTDGARAIRSIVALILPVFLGLWALLAVPALFLGICMGGWGPFQGMGLPSPHVTPEVSWKRWLPMRLGCPIGTLAHDLVGMAECGALCMLPVAAVVLGVDGWRAALAALLLAGLGFAPCYYLARLVTWDAEAFAVRQQWGEVFTGALIGAVFVGIGLCRLS